MHALWEPVPVEPGLLYRGRIGDMTVWIERSPDAWCAAFSPAVFGPADSAPLDSGPMDSGPADEPLAPANGPAAAGTGREAGELAWEQWIAGGETSVVRLVPALPDLPVVVRPRYPLRIPPGLEASFNVALPVWIRVVVGDPPGIRLCEKQGSAGLPRTWLGDPTEGELCYAVKAGTDGDPGAAPNGETARGVSVACPVRVRNTSQQELDFQRVCLRVEHLAVHRCDAGLWTNAVTVLYQGDAQMARIELSDSPPEGAGRCERICEPRVTLDRSFVGRSFQMLRVITGMEGV